MFKNLEPLSNKTSVNAILSLNHSPIKNKPLINSWMKHVWVARWLWNYYLFNQYVRKCDAYLFENIEPNIWCLVYAYFFELVENILYDQLIFNIIYFDKNWNVINVKGLSRFGSVLYINYNYKAACKLVCRWQLNCTLCTKVIDALL